MQGRTPLQPEQALLVRLARTEIPAAEREPIRALLKRSPIEWEEVVRQARAHRVAPLLHRHVQDLFPDLVPPAAKARLRALFHAHLRCSLLLSRELPDLLVLFERRGIDAIPFKGPVLAARAYRDATLRAFGDLDLLVPPRDVERAVATLQEARFEEVNPLPSRYATRWSRYLPWQDPHGNANGYVRDRGTPGAVAVDLHWGLASRYFLFPMRPEELRERLVPVTLESGDKVLTFSPEDTLLFLCAHATKHNWEALRCVCDIAELIRSYPAMDWTWTLDRARALRSERMLLVGLHVAETLLRAPVPPPVRAQAAARPDVAALSKAARTLLFDRDREKKALRARLKRAVRVSRFHLHIRDRWSDGLGASFHHLRLAMTPTQEDRAWIDLPGRLSFLYVLVRPLRILSKALLGAPSQNDAARPVREAAPEG